MKLTQLQEVSQKFVGMDREAVYQKIQEYMLVNGVDLSTFYQELEMSSRYAETHQDISYSNLHMQLHSHVFYELLYCINSCDVEYLVGSERYRLQRGDIVIVPPGISHRPLLPARLSEPYTRYVLWLSPEFIKIYENQSGDPLLDSHDRARLLRTQGSRWEHLGEWFQKGVQESQQRLDGWEAAVLGNTMMLLTQIRRAMTDCAAPAMEAETPDLLEQVIAYIEGNYHADITLLSISRQFYVSSSTISHLFQHKLGVSCYRYITQRRLIAAKALIEQNVLLADVALQTGFPDYSGFYRAFKREYGISPRQYRILQKVSGEDSF